MATKKTSSRTKSKSAAATERERKKRELHSRQQFWAIVVFAVAVFIMATTLVEGQNVWNWIHNFFLGMFGWSAYLIAPLLFYVSIMTALDKPIGLVGHKVWQSMLLICLLSGATQVFGSGIPNGNLIEKFLSLFQNGVDGHGGGAVSGLFGLPLLYWFGPADFCGADGADRRDTDRAVSVGKKTDAEDGGGLCRPFGDPQSAAAASPGADDGRGAGADQASL